MSTLVQLEDIAKDISQSVDDRWKNIVSLITPNHSFLIHQALFSMLSPEFMWYPSMERKASSNAQLFMDSLGISSWSDFHKFSVQYREEFWMHCIDFLNIQFSVKPDTMFGNGYDAYLPGGKLNIADSCFNTKQEHPAIVYRCHGQIYSWSSAMLQSLSNKVSNSLVALGFVKGDFIAIDMPMTAESIAIYLGIVQCGMAVVSIADSFAPDEIRVRLETSGAKLVFTQDCIIRGSKRHQLYTRVLKAGPMKCIIIGGGSSDLFVDSDIQLRECDLEWSSFIDNQSAEFIPVVCSPDDITNLLFSSGTTATPKAIPWTHTTPIKAAVDGYFYQDIHSGDVVCWPTNLGWMMGPWLVYASLINRATIALFDGPPTGLSFVSFVEDVKVTMLGVVPSIVSALRTTLPNLAWTTVRTFSSTGEASDPDDYHWLMSRVQGYAPIVEYCGGTEIGGAYLCGNIIQPQSPSLFSTPALGLDIVLMNEDCREGVSGAGEVAIVPPSLGLSTTLLNKDHFIEYFEGMPSGLRRHGDQLQKLSNSYYRALGRSDDTMNLGGIKTSSVELERVCNSAYIVKESAAIAYQHASGGPSQLIVFAVTSENCCPIFLKRLLQTHIKSELNPLFHIFDVVLVPVLPRTASNKIMRRSLRSMYVSNH